MARPASVTAHAADAKAKIGRAVSVLPRTPFDTLAIVKCVLDLTKGGEKQQVTWAFIKRRRVWSKSVVTANLYLSNSLNFDTQLRGSWGCCGIWQQHVIDIQMVMRPFLHVSRTASS